ncbi:MAG: fatty acid desaturase [Variibacter sp.]|nr:fatty acid desaturase [Variibacter sp.]
MSMAFHRSLNDAPHPARAKAILKAHPEIRTLIGRNPWTAAIVLGVVAMQTAIAGAMGHLGVGHWWVALIVAYLVGAFANHAMYVAIHDATHHTIFGNRLLNRLTAIVADLPNVVPGAIGFGICHLQHHVHLGDEERDTDVASDWEARLIGNRWYMKALWLAFFPVFQVARTGRLQNISVVNRWTLISAAAAAVYDVAIVLLFGWNALIYLFASFVFSIGFHPLGARWIQEHHSFEGRQETFDYYGPFNKVALNIGYHNEHHDFPSIPWNRLPQVRAMAPEFYDTLKWRASWTRLMLEFIFDQRYSLYSRVTRVSGRQDTPEATSAPAEKTSSASA